MTYDSAIRELFVQLPDLRGLYREQFPYLADEELPYVVFESFLIPVIEKALENHNAERVGLVCAYLEDAAVNASNDPRLRELLRVGIGEWLNGTSWESEIAPSLGAETKRICRYVPGLGTQRNQLRDEHARRSFLARLLDRFRA